MKQKKNVIFLLTILLSSILLMNESYAIKNEEMINLSLEDEVINVMDDEKMQKKVV